ncbi:MAG TPA: PadR family transcriptional regulator [Clostridium sp.]|nr:PadR family transcriptional regulator [Clostridium sp.]
MSTIDLIVLGMLEEQSLSAYDVQKLVEYRKISKWVKISTPSIYKKVIQLEEKGYVKKTMIKEKSMAEKAVYSLTSDGKTQLKKLMLGISEKPIDIFLDFNAVIVNLKSLSKEEQEQCLNNIEENIKIRKQYIEENIESKKDISEISETAKQVLQQQFILTEAIENWINSVKASLRD